jgi:uncharacterized protein (TIGR01244 family)
MGEQISKREYPGVENFSRVDATIACGGATTPAAIQALKADGFTSIVNLRAADEPGANVDGEASAAQKAGVRYFHLPFKAAAPDTAIVDRFLAVVAEPANQPVFIHCATANRVAALWLIKRVRLDGWTVDKAMTEAEAIGLTSEPLRRFALGFLGRRAPR